MISKEYESCGEWFLLHFHGIFGDSIYGDRARQCLLLCLCMSTARGRARHSGPLLDALPSRNLIVDGRTVLISAFHSMMT